MAAAARRLLGFVPFVMAVALAGSLVAILVLGSNSAGNALQPLGESPNRLAAMQSGQVSAVILDLAHASPTERETRVSAASACSVARRRAPSTRCVVSLTVRTCASPPCSRTFIRSRSRCSMETRM